MLFLLASFPFSYYPDVQQSTQRASYQTPDSQKKPPDGARPRSSHGLIFGMHVLQVQSPGLIGCEYSRHMPCLATSVKNKTHAEALYFEVGLSSAGVVASRSLRISVATLPTMSSRPSTPYFLWKMLLYFLSRYILRCIALFHLCKLPRNLVWVLAIVSGLSRFNIQFTTEMKPSDL